MNEKNFNIPNIISSCRIASVPLMVACIFLDREALFTWLLLAALISDILDGVIARVFHLITKLGAILDAAADMGTYLSAAIGIFAFRMEFVREYWPGLAVVFGFYVLEKISSYARYGKIFNAFHTLLSKFTAYGQGAFVMSLFLFGFKAWLFYPALVVCVLANIEEIIITGLLPGYPMNVKGLYWVLKNRKKTA